VRLARCWKEALCHERQNVRASRAARTTFADEPLAATSCTSDGALVGDVDLIRGIASDVDVIGVLECARRHAARRWVSARRPPRRIFQSTEENFLPNVVV